MATINISDLRPTGSELFSDSESYMSELGNNELDSINGGATTIVVSLAIRSSPACIKVVHTAVKVASRIAGLA